MLNQLLNLILPIDPWVHFVCQTLEDNPQGFSVSDQAEASVVIAARGGTLDVLSVSGLRIRRRPDGRVDVWTYYVPCLKTNRREQRLLQRAVASWLRWDSLQP